MLPRWPKQPERERCEPTDCSPEHPPQLGAGEPDANVHEKQPYDSREIPEELLSLGVPDNDGWVAPIGELLAVREFWSRPKLLTRGLRLLTPTGMVASCGSVTMSEPHLVSGRWRWTGTTSAAITGRPRRIEMD